MTLIEYWLLASAVSFVMFLPMPYKYGNPGVAWNVITCSILAIIFGWALWPFQIIHALAWDK